MKILMVTMALGIGGAETHIVELSRSLTKMGHDVTVASAGGVYASELEKSNIRHVTLPLSDKKVSSVYKAYKGLCKLISAENFDVVHGHARIPNFILSLVRKKLEFNFVTTAHLDFSVNFLWRKLTKWGDRTIAVSNDIKEYLIREYSLSPDRIDVTVNGIDMDKFSPDTPYSGVLSEFSLDPSHKRVVYISRIDHDRSLVAFMLCDCAKDLAEGYPDIDLIIVGAGDDFERLTDVAESINSSVGRKLITLCGARSDINAFCAMADVFVAVSRSALEAMSARVPVIVAGNQGYLGIFNETKLDVGRDTNFCCRGCDMPERNLLLNEVCTLLDMDDESKESLVKYGQDVVREFYSAEKMAQDYISCYSKL